MSSNGSSPGVLQIHRYRDSPLIFSGVPTFLRNETDSPQHTVLDDKPNGKPTLCALEKLLGRAIRFWFHTPFCTLLHESKNFPQNQGMFDVIK